MGEAMQDPHREFLRHVVATLAYRGGKVLRDAPEGLATLRISDASRTPVEILGHIGDLFEWAHSIARGEEAWPGDTEPRWELQVERFYGGLARLEEVLASDAPLRAPAEKLFQGPLADALTHVGQLAMLRRLVGTPVRGENYFRADIGAGRVGRDQAAPRREFD